MLLHLRDGRDQLAAFGDEAHDPAVDLVQALTQAGDPWLLLVHPRNGSVFGCVDQRPAWPAFRAGLAGPAGPGRVPAVSSRCWWPALSCWPSTSGRRSPA